MLNLSKRIHAAVYFFVPYFLDIILFDTVFWCSLSALLSSHAQRSASKVYMGTLAAERLPKFIVCCDKIPHAAARLLGLQLQLHHFLNNPIILCKAFLFMPQFPLCETGGRMAVRIKGYNKWCIFGTVPGKGNH